MGRYDNEKPPKTSKARMFVMYMGMLFMLGYVFFTLMNIGNDSNTESVIDNSPEECKFDNYLWTSEIYETCTEYFNDNNLSMLRLEDNRRTLLDTKIFNLIKENCELNGGTWLTWSSINGLEGYCTIEQNIVELLPKLGENYSKWEKHFEEQDQESDIGLDIKIGF